MGNGTLGCNEKFRRMRPGNDFKVFTITNTQAHNKRLLRIACSPLRKTYFVIISPNFCLTAGLLFVETAGFVRLRRPHPLRLRRALTRALNMRVNLPFSARNTPFSGSFGYFPAASAMTGRLYRFRGAAKTRDDKHFPARRAIMPSFARGDKHFPARRALMPSFARGDKHFPCGGHIPCASGGRCT